MLLENNSSDIVSAAKLKEQMLDTLIKVYDIAKENKQFKQAEKFYGQYISTKILDITEKSNREMIFDQFPAQIKRFERDLERKRLSKEELSLERSLF